MWVNWVLRFSYLQGSLQIIRKKINFYLEHVVVGLSGEHDFAGEDLVDRHGHGPQVDAEVVRNSQHWNIQFRSKLEQKMIAYKSYLNKF